MDASRVLTSLYSQDLEAQIIFNSAAPILWSRLVRTRHPHLSKDVVL